MLVPVAPWLHFEKHWLWRVPFNKNENETVVQLGRIKGEGRYVHLLGLKCNFQNRIRGDMAVVLSHAFIPSLNKYFMNTNCVPAGVLSAEDVENKADPNPDFKEPIFLRKHWTVQQIRQI